MPCPDDKIIQGICSPLFPPSFDHSLSGPQSITSLSGFNLFNMLAGTLLRRDCKGLWCGIDGNFPWIKRSSPGIIFTSFAVIHLPTWLRLPCCSGKADAELSKSCLNWIWLLEQLVPRTEASLQKSLGSWAAGFRVTASLVFWTKRFSFHRVGLIAEALCEGCFFFLFFL